MLKQLVRAALGRDFDYRRAYARADLKADHWSVVGPATRQEYEHLGRVKLGHLLDLGLSPTDAVLDVGCGTGLLTSALEGFLDERGVYVGTDIAEEAVVFCRARFRRPNFSFVRSEMISLPLEGRVFDAVVFYSVLTHTYPEETTLLLREAARLLRSSGWAFADFFTSRQVAGHAGNRGAVVLHPDLLRRVVEDSELRAELAFAMPWGQGQREFFRFTTS